MNPVRRRPRAVAIAIAAPVEPAIGPIDMLVALVATILAGFLTALR
jgi:hypothetical protein